MGIEAVLGMLVAKFPAVGFVLMGLGGLVVIGLVYVKLTPNVEDDALVAKIEAMPIVGDLLKALKSFSPVQRKEAPKA